MNSDGILIIAGVFIMAGANKIPNFNQTVQVATAEGIPFAKRSFFYRAVKNRTELYMLYQDAIAIHTKGRSKK